MSKADDIYRSIYEARNAIRSSAYAKLQQRLVVSYLLVLEDVRAKLKAGDFTENEYKEILNQIESALKRWQTSTSKNVRTAADDVISEVRKEYARAINEINAAYDVELTINTKGFNTAAYEAMYLRRGLNLSGQFKTLQNWNISGAELIKEIDDLLVNSIKDGKSWRDLQTELARKLAFNNDEAKALLRAAQKAGFDLNDLPDDDNLKTLKRLMFDARRIAVSEINTAYAEASRVGAVRSPVVKGVKWQTSGRHDGLFSSPDVCDVLESADLHGLGEGIYHPETLPALPHPNCGCTKIDVLKEPAEWFQEDQRSIDKPRKYSTDEVEGILKQFEDARSPTLTPNYVKRQTDELNRTSSLAFEYYQKRDDAAA